MRHVREIVKKSDQFLGLLEMQTDGNQQKVNEAMNILQVTQLQCEDCIQKLMSEQSANSISNHETLLEKMFGYQEQLRTCLELI